MTEHNIFTLRSAERRSQARKLRYELQTIVPLALCMVSSACMSDVEVPDCALHATCRSVGGGVGGGGTGALPVAGSGTHAGGAIGEPLESGGEEGNSEAGSGGDAGAEMGGAASGNGGFSEGGSSGRAATSDTAGKGGTASNGGTAGSGGAPPHVVPRIPVTVLTPPCAHHAYSKTLTLSGNAPPYQWQVLSSDWEIAVDPADSANAVLSTRAAAAGTSTVELRLTDSLGGEATQRLTLEARATCYFAFTALEDEDARLKLLDPLAETPVPVALQHNHGVYDFQFSPDGQFLAYRHDADATHPTGQHIALVTIASLQEQELSFQEASISAFSWSPDSSLLAIAFVSNDVTYLGGVLTPASSASPVALAATAAPVQSQLSWIGNSYVAFHAELIPDFNHPGQFFPDPIEHRRTAFFAALGPQGFAASKGIIEATYSPGIHVQASNEGFFVITDQGPGFAFNQLNNNRATPFSHFDASLVSPSGRYSASNSEDDQLQLFGAADGTLSPPSGTSKDGESCPMLLAWARTRERIACVADVQNTPLDTTHGEIRIYDLTPNAETLDMSVLDDFCTDDTNAPIGTGTCAGWQPRYNYGTSKAAGSARGFSASGRWFAFTTTSALDHETLFYLADLNKGFELERKVDLRVTNQISNVARPTDLAFSPDENFLLLRQGNVLSVHGLTTSGAAIPAIVSEDLELGKRCVENFAKQPNAWCGNTDLSAPLAWSDDSRFLAFRSPGKLTVVDNTQFPALDKFPLEATDCGQKCTNQFAFQPSAAR